MTLQCTLSLLLLVTSNVSAYKFLVISPVFGFSHMKSMAAIGNQLADAGHQVTYLQPVVAKQYLNHSLVENPAVEVISYWNDEESYQGVEEELSDAWTSSKRIMTPSALHTTFGSMCKKMFKDEGLHEMLKAKEFDVVLSETFDFCGLYLADYLQMPSIVSVFTGSRLKAISNALGEPSFLHYFPLPSTRIGPEMTIYDRFHNLWYSKFSSGSFSKLFDLQYELVSWITKGKVRHWTEILNDVTYHFTNSNPYLDFVTPTIPKVVPIGGYTMDYTEVPPVAKELDELLDKRPFTVFVSYGSMAASKFMPEAYKWGMIHMFRNNPNVTFLWKYEDPEEEFIRHNLPSNVHTAKWLPQQSLLVDKRVKLFITHGGLGSAMELAYAAKPAIVTPLFADQPGNAQMLSRHGSVEIYSKFDIPDWKKQSELLRSMLREDSYQTAATRLADVLHHQPIAPRKLMLKHAETAARLGRIPTLTPFVKDMPFVDYYNLDIIAYGISFVLFAIYGVLEVHCIWRKYCVSGGRKECVGERCLKVE